MLRFIAKRFLETIPVLLIVATLTFFMMKMAPGGPFDTEKATTPEIKAQLEAQYGLNKPVFSQYLDYMGQLLRGDLGPSFKYAGWSVTEDLVSGAGGSFFAQPIENNSKATRLERTLTMRTLDDMQCGLLPGARRTRKPEVVTYAISLAVGAARLNRYLEFTAASRAFPPRPRMPSNRHLFLGKSSRR